MNKMMVCPMMNKMNWGINPQMYPELEDIYAEDDRDDEYFMDMHPDSCKRITPYINRELDMMETEESPLYEEYPNREMLERMGDKVYDKVVADMPEMEEQWEGRQFGRRRFLRDLVGLLILGNISRRRRRRRRRRHDYDNDYWYNY
ncbi:MAG: hypothetical protein WCY24_06735 [Lutispora sp.]